MPRLTNKALTAAVLVAAMTSAATALAFAPYLVPPSQADALTASLSQPSAICITPASGPAAPANPSTP